MKEVFRPSVKEPFSNNIPKHTKEEKERIHLIKSDLKFKEFSNPNIAEIDIPRKVKPKYSRRNNSTAVNEKILPKKTLLKFEPKIKKTLEKDVIRIKFKKKSLEKKPVTKRKITILGVPETGAQILKRFSKEKEKAEDSKTPENDKSGEGQKKSVLDIIEKIFGISDKELSDQDNIKIILYKDSNSDETIGSFETLCMRIYRERHGSKAPYKLIIEESEYNLEELENWLEGEESITRIDVDKPRIMKKLIENRDALKQLFARTINKKLGFIIFKTKDIEKYWQLGDLFNKWNLSSHNLNIYKLEAKSFSIEIKKVLSKLFWGNIKIKTDLLDIITFDMLFNKSGQEEYQQKLESEKEILFKFSTNKNQGKKSKTHFWIKVFLVKILSERLSLALDREIIKKKIRTEHKIKEVNADVFIEDSDTVYEVETLFGTGRDGNDPIDKIIRTIEKYVNIDKIKNINIVLENFTLIRHIKDLLEIKRNLESWEEKFDKKFNFYTIDLENKSLVSLNDVLIKLKTIHNKI